MNLEVHVLHDPLNSKIQERELFTDIIAFKKAIRHYVVVIGFEFAKPVRTDKTRFVNSHWRPSRSGFVFRCL